jgi:hypothetical protein
MSNPDSFIEEVTEEVRRDRLYGYARRYGWIGAVLVVLIVGGAAWREYSAAQHMASAQAFGDGLIDALDLGEAEARAAALAEVPANGAQSAIKALVQAADPQADRAAAAAALAAVADDATQPQMYRDLANLRRVMLAGGEMPLADRRSVLEEMSSRGFGLLAREQLAYLLIEEGKPDEAIAALSALMQDQAAPAGLVARASRAITALGGIVPEIISPNTTPPQTSAG